MLPELSDPLRSESNALSKEFSSEDSVLSLDQTITLLKDHNLMVEDVQLEDIEILR